MSNKVYMIGDTHYGHNQISEKFRQEFSSDGEHNETIHENVMSCAGKRNHLWLLGDIVLKDTHFPKIIQYAKSFDSVHITLGNHCHKNLPALCIDNGIHVHGIVKKWGFWICHAPIHPQELYRGNCVHGHTHADNVDDDRYFSVSCENVGYKPITLVEVREVFKERGVLDRPVTDHSYFKN